MPISSYCCFNNHVQYGHNIFPKFSTKGRGGKITLDFDSLSFYYMLQHFDLRVLNQAWLASSFQPLQ